MSLQKQLQSLLHDLVGNYADFDGDTYSLHLDDLPDDEQGKLASAYLETINRDVNECVWGNDFTTDSTYVCAMLKMLKDPSDKNRDDFARLVNKNILIYFHDNLQDFINDACNKYLNNEMNDHGYYSHINRNHGDIMWSKHA